MAVTFRVKMILSMVPIFILITFNHVCVCANNIIEYKLVMLNRLQDTKTEQREKITTTENTWSIKVLNELPNLKKGMLEIRWEVRVLELIAVNLTNIEPGSFDNQNITETICITFNPVTTIRTGTFKNLPVRELDLSNNGISHIEKGAFEDLSRLESLIISDNHLTDLNSDFIINTPSLMILSMGGNYLTKLQEHCLDFVNPKIEFVFSAPNNKIETVGSGVFRSLNINILDFGNNKLKEIPDVQPNCTRLLNLENNDVTELPNNFFETFKDATVYLQGNPLACEAFRNNLKDLTEMLRNILVKMETFRL